MSEIKESKDKSSGRISIDKMVKALREYDGEPLTFMEVCGSHTAAISKFGIRDILSDRIRLISGPGCPVCVTPSAYVDRLIELSLMPNTKVLSFGDMLRVPGSLESLSTAKGHGADCDMVYSPLEIVEQAKKNPSVTYIFAAVGFETTAPIYSLIMDEILEKDIKNIKLLTSLKVMPPVIENLMVCKSPIDGFIAPGHVCAITGYDYFSDLAKKYSIPFAVSGFEAEELITAIYGLLNMALNRDYSVKNFYPSVVSRDMNDRAWSKLMKYFEYYDASWRGIGQIKNSGLILRPEFRKLYDAGSSNLNSDLKADKGCICGDILMGRKEPGDCPLIGKICNPDNPRGACMVSYEGACFHAVSRFMTS